MDASDTNFQGYTDVVMNRAFLDWEMQCLQSKIKAKNEENSKLEILISERKIHFEKLKKTAKSVCENEEKVKDNINNLRNSRIIADGLLMNLKQQLRIHEEKRNENLKTREFIIQKYSNLFELYSKIYSSLPWIKETNKLKSLVEQKKIQLNILKLNYATFKKKKVLFNKIRDQRIIVSITKMAGDIVARNNLQKEVDKIINDEMILKLKIKQLQDEKIKLQEKVEQKVRQAVAEARERVVKSQIVTNSSDKLHHNIIVESNLAQPSIPQLKPINESIFSRLGLSEPFTLKRPALIRPKIPIKIPCLVEDKKKSEIVVKRKVESNTTGISVEEKVNDSSCQVQSSEKFQTSKSSETNKDTEPTNLPVENINTDNKQIPVNKTDRKKKKMKKKVKTNSKIDNCVIATEQEKEKIIRSVPELMLGNEEVISQEKFELDVDKSLYRDMSISHSIVDVSISISKNDELENVPFDKQQSEKAVEENEKYNKALLNDPDMNASNLSLDNVSQISSTFINENRNQINSSPDFMAQTPQKYCFSPLYSPSKTDVSEISSLKGGKSPNYDFPSTSSAVTSLFTTENKIGGGKLSDFSSFFSTGSKKENEKSTKNFFQLFG